MKMGIAADAPPTPAAPRGAALSNIARAARAGAEGAGIRIIILLTSSAIITSFDSNCASWSSAQFTPV
jgi:hypothetical protein